MNNQKCYSKELVLLNCCGDEEFVKTVVNLFIEHMPKYYQELETGVQQQNWDVVYRNAHTMKANIDLFSIESLKTLIREIEKQGKTSSPDPLLPEQMQSLKTILFACMHDLKQDFAVEAKLTGC